jgi:nucleoside-diphosphate-sugar epimerase
VARQDFVDTNITGTLNLLEEAAALGIAAKRPKEVR